MGERFTAIAVELVLIRIHVYGIVVADLDGQPVIRAGYERYHTFVSIIIIIPPDNVNL